LRVRACGQPARVGSSYQPTLRARMAVGVTITPAVGRRVPSSASWRHLYRLDAGALDPDGPGTVDGVGVLCRPLTVTGLLGLRVRRGERQTGHRREPETVDVPRVRCVTYPSSHGTFDAVPTISRPNTLNSRLGHVTESCDDQLAWAVFLPPATAR